MSVMRRDAERRAVGVSEAEWSLSQTVKGKGGSVIEVGAIVSVDGRKGKVTKIEVDEHGTEKVLVDFNGRVVPYGPGMLTVVTTAKLSHENTLALSSADAVKQTLPLLEKHSGNIEIAMGALEDIARKATTILPSLSKELLKIVRKLEMANEDLMELIDKTE